jgi:hypothetical protein
MRSAKSAELNDFGVTLGGSRRPGAITQKEIAMGTSGST